MRYHRSFPRILRSLKKQYPALPIFSIDGSDLTPDEVLLAIAAAIGPEAATTDPDLQAELRAKLKEEGDVNYVPINIHRDLHMGDKILINWNNYIFVRFDGPNYIILTNNQGEEIRRRIHEGTPIFVQKSRKRRILEAIHVVDNINVLLYRKGNTVSYDGKIYTVVRFNDWTGEITLRRQDKDGDVELNLPMDEAFRELIPLEHQLGETFEP